MTTSRIAIAALLVLSTASSSFAQTVRPSSALEAEVTCVGNPPKQIPELGLAVERLGDGSYRVNSLEQGSSGEWIGIRRGDILLTINGTPVSQIRNWDSATRCGYEVKVYRPTTGETRWMSHIASRPTNRSGGGFAFTPASFNPNLNTIERATPNGWIPATRPSANLPGVARGPQVMFLNGQIRHTDQRSSSTSFASFGSRATP